MSDRDRPVADTDARSPSVVSVPPTIQHHLRDECRIMQGLAQACEHFGTDLPAEGPRTEELLFAVAAQWEKIYEILLRVSGQEPWPSEGQPWPNGARVLE